MIFAPRAAHPRFQPFGPSRFEEELALLHFLSLSSFADAFLYTPISLELFANLYRKMQKYVMPDLVLFAEHDRKTLGFVFALPDLLCAKRGVGIDTVVVKTLAELPEWQGRGLGAYLLGEVGVRARDCGFRRAIHALMHETNSSRSLSSHFTTEIRGYALYCRDLR